MLSLFRINTKEQLKIRVFNFEIKNSKEILIETKK